MRIHVKPVKCPRCDYTAAEQNCVRRHIEVNHKSWAKENWKVVHFSCEVCDKTFTRKDNLQRHQKKTEHFGSNDRSTCE